MNVEFDDWDAGWFASTAYVSLDMGQDGAFGFLSTPGPVPVILRHGPVLSGTPSGLGWASIELAVDGSVHPLLQELQEDFGVEVAYLGVLVGIWGSATIGVEVPDSSSYGRDAEADFGGLEARATLSSDSIDLAGEFGGLRAVDGHGRVDIGRITFAAGASKVSGLPGLWLGDAWINGTGYKFWDDGRGEGGEAEDFLLRVDTRIRKDMFEAAVQSDVSELLFNDVRLSDLVAEFSFQYSADALASLMRLVERMRDDARASHGGGFDSIMGGLDAALEMATTAGTLLRERAAVGIDRISFRHEDRSASAALMAEFRGDELSGFSDIVDILDFRGLGEMYGNLARLPLSVNLNVAFHQDLPRGLASAMGVTDARTLAQLDSTFRRLEGLVLEARDDDYTMRVEFDSGTLYVNGGEIPLSDLIENVVEGGLGVAGQLLGIGGGILGF